VVYTRVELEAIAEVALKHGLYVVSDEMYEPMVYDGLEHASVGSFSAELQAKTITVNGFSKAYSMTGWRLGYMGAPADIAKAVISLQSHSTSGPNTFAQYAALAALTGSQDCVAEMVKAFDQRRQLLYGRLEAIDGVTCVQPQGAFYMLPNISSFGLDTVAFCDRLLEEQKTAMVPGEAFSADGNVRISYACSEAVINEGMDRLAAFVKGL
jgi:aspartate aminotransferase